MMFGEAASESPRVPSPWTKPRSIGSRSSSVSTPQSVRKGRIFLRTNNRGEADDGTSSTPPTDEEEGEDSDGFFSLDQTLDLDKLNMIPINNQESSYESSSSTATLSTSPLPIKRLAPEPDALGNLEYKLRILPPTRHRYDRLLTQMKWRLLQGGGQCTYEIGVLDDGRCIGICPVEMRASLRVLSSLAAELGAMVHVRRAFTLLQGNALEGMNREKADEELLERPIDLVSEEIATFSCGCKMDEVNIWPNAQSVNLNIDSEYSSPYRIDINDHGTESYQGSWMGGFDGMTGSEDECEEDKEDENDEIGCTYSLSYDERATMKATPQRRGVFTRKKCRYKAIPAAQKRQKEINVKMGKGNDKEATLQVLQERPLLKHSLSNSVVESGELQPSSEAISSEEAHAVLSNGGKECKRILVEAVVSKSASQIKQDYIDYTSL